MASEEKTPTEEKGCRHSVKGDPAVWEAGSDSPTRGQRHPGVVLPVKPATEMEGQVFARAGVRP